MNPNAPGSRRNWFCLPAMGLALGCSASPDSGNGSAGNGGSAVSTGGAAGYNGSYAGTSNGTGGRGASSGGGSGTGGSSAGGATHGPVAACPSEATAGATVGTWEDIT